MYIHVPHTCTCMYYMYVHITHMYMYVHVTHTCTCMYLAYITHTCTCTCMYYVHITHTCICMYTYHMYMYTLSFPNIYIQVYVLTHIHTHREQLQSQPDASLLQQITNDVNRTDRSHPFYKGDGNKNLDRLQ